MKVSAPTQQDGYLVDSYLVHFKHLPLRTSGHVVIYPDGQG